MISKIITGNQKKESESLLKHAFSSCRELGITKLIIQLSRVSDIKKIEKWRKDESIAWVSMEKLELPKEMTKTDILISVPKSPLTRISQMRVGLFFAIAQDFVEVDESVIALSGDLSSRRLDTLMMLNGKRDIPWYQKKAHRFTSMDFSVRTLERTIHCALRLSAEGREGRPIGSIFVIGKPKSVMPFTRQLILNPLEGHPKKARNLDNPEFFETLREFSALDGAFIVSPNGTVESAGTYLGVQTHASLKLLPGLGARHAAAAALTNRCKTALAVVVSESSGTVSIMQAGSIVLKIERTNKPLQPIDP